MIGAPPPWTRAQTLQGIWAGQITQIEEYFCYLQQAFDAGLIDDLTLFSAFEAFESPINSVGTFCYQWLEQHPNSYAANLSCAFWHGSMSAEARGMGLGSSITADVLSVITNHELRAREHATASVGLATKPIVSFVKIGGSLRILRNLEGVRPEHLDWYEAGLAAHPSSVLIRGMKLSALAPEWGGSFEEMEELVNHRDTVALGEEAHRYIQASAHRLRSHTLAHFEGKHELALWEVDLADQLVPGLMWNTFCRGNVYLAANDRDAAAAQFASLAADSYQRELSPLDYWYNARTDESPEHYQLALRRVELGSRAALDALAAMFAGGHFGMPKDGEQLEYWSRRSFSEGSADGLGSLSFMIRHGTHGFKKDAAKANELVLAGAKAGGAYCCNSAWAFGDQLRLSRSEAIRYLLSALRGADIAAAYNLAEHEISEGKMLVTSECLDDVGVDEFVLTNGRLTDEHIQQAIHFYQVAIGQGHKNAERELLTFRAKHPG